MPVPTSVLLIDDDNTANFLTARLVRRLPNVLVHAAESGEQALDWLHLPTTELPSLMLLDVNMPGLSGPDFLAQYRQQFPASNTVVYVLTTTTNPAELALFATLNVAGILAKPLTHEQLAALLAQHFQYQLPGVQY